MDELHRAFADPAKHGKTPDQVKRLKSWLPPGMPFTTPAAEPKPAKAKKGKQAA